MSKMLSDNSNGDLALLIPQARVLYVLGAPPKLSVRLGLIPSAVTF